MKFFLGIKKYLFTLVLHFKVGQFVFHLFLSHTFIIIDYTLSFFFDCLVADGLFHLQFASVYLISISFEDSQSNENVESIVDSSFNVHLSSSLMITLIYISVNIHFIVKLADKFSSNFFISGSFLLSDKSVCLCG